MRDTVTASFEDRRFFHGSMVDGTSVRDTFVLCLRPGSYVLSGFMISYGIQYLKPRTEWNIPVIVEPGKTKYLGSYIAYSTAEHDDCAPSGVNGFHITLRNKWADDRASIEKDGESNGQQFVVELPDFTGVGGSVLACIKS
jgi:hypothetical protein